MWPAIDTLPSIPLPPNIRATPTRAGPHEELPAQVPFRQGNRLDGAILQLNGRPKTGPTTQPPSASRLKLINLADHLNLAHGRDVRGQ